MQKSSQPSALSGHQPIQSITSTHPSHYNYQPAVGSPLRLLHLHESPCRDFLQLATCPIKYLSHSFHTSLGFHHVQQTHFVALWDHHGVCLFLRVCVRPKSITLLIFSFGCVRRAGKWLRASQLSTTCVCSSVPVTMFPTALRAAVWMCVEML